MARLNASNNAETILTNPVSESDTTITVDDASVFPDAPFLISVNDEIIKVTEINNNTLTVERAQENTVATNHDVVDVQNNPTTVKNCFTAGMYYGLSTKKKVEDLEQDFMSHKADDAIHVTSQEKQDWNDHLTKIASENELGNVKVDGDTITIDSEGRISSEGGSDYELPKATASTLGGVMSDNETTIISDGVISVNSWNVVLRKTDEIIIGNDAVSEGYESVSIGKESKAGQSSIAIGGGAETSAHNGVSLGRMTRSGANATAVGSNAWATGQHSTAIGAGVKVNNIREGVLGGSTVTSTNSWLVPGDFTVEGTKNFEMPHPKPEKSATHRIRHGAVESPTAGDTLYRFTVESTKENDMQTIDLPDYFIYLNKDVQVFVTPQNHFGNGYGILNEETEQLEIHCQTQGQYNVLVIGTRNDNHQSVQDWDIKGVEREVGESWTGEAYNFDVEVYKEIEIYKEESS